MLQSLVLSAWYSLLSYWYSQQQQLQVGELLTRDKLYTCSTCDQLFSYCFLFIQQQLQISRVGLNADACSQDASRKAVVNNVVATRAKFALVATECHGHLVSRSPRLTFMNHVADVIGCRFSLKLL